MIAAIGDVHGCLTELRELIARLLVHLEPQGGTLVMLGDYIDRGPDSKGVIDFLKNWDHPSVKLVCLMGNHDYMMVESVLRNDREMTKIWMTRDSGGAATKSSMGSSLIEHAQWMDDNLLAHYREGDLFFAHAGVDPDYSLDDQIGNDLLWIREPFLSHKGDFGARIVHGHSPAYGVPEILRNRVNLDTGCVFGGTLTGAIFDDAGDVIAIESVDPDLR